MAGGNPTQLGSARARRGQRKFYPHSSLRVPAERGMHDDGRTGSRPPDHVDAGGAASVLRAPAAKRIRQEMAGLAFAAADFMETGPLSRLKTGRRYLE